MAWVHICERSMRDLQSRKSANNEQKTWVQRSLKGHVITMLWETLLMSMFQPEAQPGFLSHGPWGFWSPLPQPITLASISTLPLCPMESRLPWTHSLPLHLQVSGSGFSESSASVHSYCSEVIYLLGHPKPWGRQVASFDLLMAPCPFHSNTFCEMGTSFPSPCSHWVYTSSHLARFTSNII